MKMQMRLLTLTIALGLGAPAWAGDGQATINELAARAGISPREVAMVLGPHSTYAEYRTSYNRARAKLNRALGGVDPQEFLAAEAVKAKAIAQTEVDLAQQPVLAQNTGQ